MKTIVLKKLGSAEIQDGTDPVFDYKVKFSINLYSSVLLLGQWQLKTGLSISKEELILISSYTWNILRENYSILPI